SNNREAALNAANLIVFAVPGEDAEELAKQFNRQPQSNPSFGRRPILTVPRNPFEHLIKTGHSQDNVNELVKQCLLPDLASLVVEMHATPTEYRKELLDGVPQRSMPHQFAFLLVETEAAYIVDALNHYLLTMMDKPPRRGQVIFDALLDLVLKGLSLYYIGSLVSSETVRYPLG